MMTKRMVAEWVNSLGDDDSIFIDEGGLTLCSADDPDAYLEVGGEPIDEDGREAGREAGG